MKERVFGGDSGGPAKDRGGGEGDVRRAELQDGVEGLGEGEDGEVPVRSKLL